MTAPDASPFAQAAYQVRLEWGVDGLRRLAPSDVVVVVDVLRFSTTVTDAVARGEAVALAGMHASSINGAAIAAAAARTGDVSAGGAAGTVVLAGSLRNPRAVAEAILAEQVRRGVRTSVAIIAGGELASREAGAPVRFAVEDLLGAGAVIDALAELGIDYCSPEAAAAVESFRALRGAVRHLLTASGSGRELAAKGKADEVVRAGELDAESAVAVLVDGEFRRLA